MEEKKIFFSKEPVRYICDRAFYAARPEGFPEELDPILAAGYGFEAGDAVANYCKEVVYPNIVEPIAEKIGIDLTLENAAKTGLGLVGIVILKYLLSPKKTIQYIKEHPVMSTGAVAVMASASRVAVKTIKEERHNEYLKQQYGISN